MSLNPIFLQCIHSRSDRYRLLRVDTARQMLQFSSYPKQGHLIQDLLANNFPPLYQVYCTRVAPLFRSVKKNNANHYAGENVQGQVMNIMHF
jgi:hypothetical protein